MALPEQVIVSEILKRGWVTLEQLEECREIQKKMTEMGLTESLVEILVKRNYLTKEQVAPLVEPEKAGKIIIPGYRVVSKIGKGGMGVVYKAVQLSIDRLVAIKVLPLRLGQEKEFADRFIREARNLAQLNHVNIVSAIDAGQVGNIMYYIMEYVDGESVGDLLKKQVRLPESQALHLVMQTARALDHAQHHSLIHRDIKPDNILVTKEGVAKLADLGLAKSTTEDANLTQTGIAIGTPNYISPEQARGERALDIRSDVYSLGATLYHMVVGEAPFKGTTALEVITKHLTEQLPSPKALNPDLSDGICIIIETMLAKDKKDRYQDPASLIQDLELVIDGKMPHAQRLTMGQSSVMHRVRVDGPAPAEAARSSSRGTTVRKTNLTARHEIPHRRSWATPVAIAAALLIAVLAFALMGRKPPSDTAVARSTPVERPSEKTQPVQKDDTAQPPKTDTSSEGTGPSGTPEGTLSKAYQAYLLEGQGKFLQLKSKKDYKEAYSFLNQLMTDPVNQEDKRLMKQLTEEQNRLSDEATKEADALIEESRKDIANFPKIAGLDQYRQKLAGWITKLRASAQTQMVMQSGKLTGQASTIYEALQLFGAEYERLKGLFAANTPTVRAMASWNFRAASDYLRLKERPRFRTETMLRVIDNISDDFQKISKDLLDPLMTDHALVKFFKPTSVGIEVTLSGSDRSVMLSHANPSRFWPLFNAKYSDRRQKLVPLVYFLVYDGNPALARALFEKELSEPSNIQDWYENVIQGAPFVMLSGGRHTIEMASSARGGEKKPPVVAHGSRLDQFLRAKESDMPMVDYDDTQKKFIRTEMSKKVEDAAAKDPDLTEEQMNKIFQDVVKRVPPRKDVPNLLTEMEKSRKKYQMSKDADFRDHWENLFEAWGKKDKDLWLLANKGDKNAHIRFGKSEWKNYIFQISASWKDGEKLWLTFREDEDGNSLGISIVKETRQDKLEVRVKVVKWAPDGKIDRVWDKELTMTLDAPEKKETPISVGYEVRGQVLRVVVGAKSKDEVMVNELPIKNGALGIDIPDRIAVKDIFFQLVQ